MNQLPLSTRTTILNLLCEGNSLRSTSRITGCSINTVTKLLVDAGKACQDFHDKTVKNIASKRIECDEIWSFVYAKQANLPFEEQMNENSEVGDIWTWVGMDADSKLIVSWFVGNRDADSANEFMYDVASRLSNRVQLTTDGFKPYLQAVDNAFSFKVDYAQLIKMYGAPSGKEAERKYSPAECTGTKRRRITGQPDMKFASTSYVERQNLTMRMHMRRFTRLTNAFSKKLENHCHAIALHFVYYNFLKVHKTLRVTPAMEAGLTQDIWTAEDIIKLVDNMEK